MLIQSETDYPDERFVEGATLYASRDGMATPLVVDRARVHAGRPLIGFQGLEAIEDVEPFGRGELRVPESALMPLPEGEYYWFQFVGAPVRTEAGDEVGQVLRVEPNGGTGVLVVGNADQEIQIPLTPELCPVLRPDAIVVRPPEGLLELNAPSERGPRRAHRHRDHLSRHGAGRRWRGRPGPGGGQRTD